MRRLIFLLQLVVTTISFISAHAQTAKQSTVSFGRFGNDCSSGRGVCAFNTQQTAETGTTSKSAVKTSDKTFILRVKRSVLTLQDEVRIAGKPFSDIAESDNILFQQIDAISLDQTTTVNLGFQEHLKKIPSGSYPMSIFKDYIEIIFTLTP